MPGSSAVAVPRRHPEVLALADTVPSALPLRCACSFYDEDSSQIAQDIFHPDVAVGRYDRLKDDNGSFVLKSGSIS